MKQFSRFVPSAFALLLILSAAPSFAGDAYPLPNCPVGGEKLGSMGDPIVHMREGREFRFCCEKCVGKFEADSATYIAKIDKEIADAQRASYPLTTCPVGGDELGAMGEPVEMIVGNRLVRLCCKGCVKGVNKDPDAVIAKLDAAVIEKQKADYPLASCVVGGEALDAMGAPVEFVHANRLVMFCCKGCVKKFQNDPGKYLAMLDDAAGLKKDVETAAADMAADAMPAAEAAGQTQER